ncbi:MAG: sulfur carrier protein ThiS [Selenomonas sp.]|nr:sulfur carrier protein ThiS [Selenomonadales bacterium]MDD7762529.1 sulfur carrier protein ThiS [Selenomonadales bacterium]MDY5717393.1 sulfur carrier protein ThiS [Selenomonas sp.]
MKLTVNGEALEIEKSINLKELLVVAKADQPEYVTVQLNGEFVDHSGFETTFVKDGDQIEFLYFMGGGAR